MLKKSWCVAEREEGLALKARKQKSQGSLSDLVANTRYLKHEQRQRASHQHSQYLCYDRFDQACVWL